MVDQINNPGALAHFGIELTHTLYEAADVPPKISASETIEKLTKLGELEDAEAISQAAEEVSMVVQVSAKTDPDKGLLDIFTAAQVEAMQQRMHEYLGTDLGSHLAEIKAPPNFSFYVGKLATQFAFQDDRPMTDYYRFFEQHSNPEPGATGPREYSSRELAVNANESLIRQFDVFYQADLDITLVGPRKKVEGSRMSWERGIAECQFLVLDFIRDQLAVSRTVSTIKRETITMTVPDIGKNLLILLGARKYLVDEVGEINRALAEQVDLGLDSLGDHTREVMHRGRLGVPKYIREPESARRAISRVQSLLIVAASLDVVREDQAEIPVLDL